MRRSTSSVLAAALAAFACGSSEPARGVPGSAGSAGGGGGGGVAGTSGSAGAGGAPCPELDASTREQLAERLAAAAVDMASNARADVATSCAGLTTGLGCATVVAPADPTDADVGALCDGAIACLDARAFAPGDTTLTGGKCESSVGLFVQCEADCGSDVPCADVCRDVVELSAFCVAPKIASSPPAWKDAIGANVPLLHGVVRRLVPLGEAALARSSARADEWLAARQTPCAASSRASIASATTSLAKAREIGERALRAAGVAPPGT